MTTNQSRLLVILNTDLHQRVTYHLHAVLSKWQHQGCIVFIAGTAEDTTKRFTQHIDKHIFYNHDEFLHVWQDDVPNLLQPAEIAWVDNDILYIQKQYITVQHTPVCAHEPWQTQPV
jgi:hypothetical protein